MSSPRQAASHAIQAKLGGEPTPAALQQIVEHGFAQLAETQAASRAPTACAAGCAFCCYHPVDITAPEAFAIAAYLQTALSPADFEAVAARLATNAERTQSFSHDEHALAKIPCAMLDDGQCQIYPARPFACRAWHSTSADRCEDIFSHGDPLSMIPPLDMALYNAQWDVVYGVAEGLRRAGLDDRPYELHSLLHRVLTTSNAVQRWLRGEDVFAGCTPGAFFD